MSKKWAGWLLLAVGTFLNLRLFLSRWSEEPRSDFGLVVSQAELASLVTGFGGLVVLLGLIDILRSGRLVALLLLPAVCVAVVLSMPSLGIFKNLEHLSVSFVGAGAVCGVLCEQLRDSEPERGEAMLWRSFVLMTCASLNAFFLMAPWTTHVPSYVQGTPIGDSMMSFYYGSVHADVSPVSAALRWIINLFFASPSINATALSSMLYVGIGLAMAGVAVEMIFGRLWGWALLVLAGTDRWLFASAVSSAVVGQPVLSTASVLLLCTWALWRKPGPLSWREASALGAINVVGLLYTLYGYSAARMTWLMGSGIAALILLLRGAIGRNFDGLRKGAVAVLPSVATVVLIWVTAFGMDFDRFKGQLFISPEAAVQIKDANSYHAPVTPVHDPDIPIWWGTGLPTDGVGIVLHWKRTPGEIYEKVKWFMQHLSQEPPVPFALVLLGGFGMAVCVTSSVPLRRWFAACLLLLTLVSFATFVSAQDHAAYRRGLATNLLLLCGVVAVFAAKCRGRYCKWLALSLCGVLAVLKAPSELNVLFHDGFWAPVCARCQPVFDVRDLVNDPGFAPLARRPLRFFMRVGTPQAIYLECFTEAVESHEFRELAPNSAAVSVRVGQLSQGFTSLSSGDVMVVSCFESSRDDSEVSGICSGNPPFGNLIAMLPAQHPESARYWWAFVAKQ